MKKYSFKLLLSILILVFVSSCDLDRMPETSFAESRYWKTEIDFKYAANQLYSLLQPIGFDTRADDLYKNSIPDLISSGVRLVPATSDDWSIPYKFIFVANRIIENAPDESIAVGNINRYVAEARFFRAYNYHLLMCKYGDIPLLKRSAQDSKDEVLFTPRTPRSEVAQFIYDELDRAAKYLPLPSKIMDSEYGRISNTAALALKARVALYEGTRAKFHNYGDPMYHLKIAYTTADSIISLGAHDLYTTGSNPYKDLFEYKGEGSSNKENIFVKLYGYSDNLLVTHNIPYGFAVNYGVTRNFLNLYLGKNGLPFNDKQQQQVTYNDYFTDRDPRLAETVLKRGSNSYTFGAFTPYQQSRTGFGIRKFVVVGINDQPSTLDFALIRYAEVLLICAEAKFEHDGFITDADLNRTINKLRKRVGFVSLTNQFVIDHGLNMRDEIRRERSVELALEGFRYDDIMRWAIAEDVLPVNLYGAKFFSGEWGSVNLSGLENKITADNVLIVEDSTVRFFNPQKDYLYPIPFNDIAQSKGTLIQNPNWK